MLPLPKACFESSALPKKAYLYLLSFFLLLSLYKHYSIGFHFMSINYTNKIIICGLSWLVLSLNRIILKFIQMYHHSISFYE